MRMWRCLEAWRGFRWISDAWKRLARLAEWPACAAKIFGLRKRNEPLEKKM